MVAVRQVTLQHSTATRSEKLVCTDERSSGWHGGKREIVLLDKLPRNRDMAENQLEDVVSDVKLRAADFRAPMGPSFYGRALPLGV
ncbi:hypothetical protein AWW66_07585 [Micromonospora rosaria]|uniref:Uncharacterized protein n=1 Tax=Micromonospora rosaria TaxID=47874 RepID=A0A136PVH1_9ACTN|nr:hypothetical protein [Micromonospora rosaria]KXK62531.1 hypothetical protein AWW66_07585 [Micromonospora rosaria]